MQIFHAMVLLGGLVLGSSVALAESPPAKQAPAAPSPSDPVPRFVPTLRNGVMIGFKTYAVQPHGRFAQFHNGDLVVEVDQLSTATAEGGKAFLERVLQGQRDAVVTVVRRDGTRVELAFQAVKP
ncbi:MAG: hypothetical protein ACTHU0_36240 [Kofleriaceae bacterium]